MHVPLGGIFGPNSGYIAHYAPFIWPKSPTNCDAHLPESNFQTRSRKRGERLFLTVSPPFSMAALPVSLAYLLEQLN